MRVRVMREEGGRAELKMCICKQQGEVNQLVEKKEQKKGEIVASLQGSGDGSRTLELMKL